MNIFALELNLNTILSITGIVFGVVSQLLVWIYLIASARGVQLPAYEDFRTNVTLSHLFSMLVLSFVCLTGSQAVAALCRNLLATELAGWIVTLFGAVLFIAFCRNSRSNIKTALGASLFKVVLTALALWVIC